jgi:hypothetical protein
MANGTIFVLVLVVMVPKPLPAHEREEREGQQASGEPAKGHARKTKPLPAQRQPSSF